MARQQALPLETLPLVRIYCRRLNHTSGNFFKYTSVTKGAIHIFNPDTDYALATSAKVYTPPARVGRICRLFSLFPALYADAGDAILSLHTVGNSRADSDSELLKLASARKLKIFSLRDADMVNSMLRDGEYGIMPWGWNQSLRRMLLNAGIDSAFLPSEEYIEMIKKLSHRSVTIDANRMLAEYGEGTDELPEIFTDTDNAMRYYESHPDCFFKAPWSSSGRGIIHCGDLEPRHIEPWLRGIIRQQGSVTAETFFCKDIDFASEWIITDSEALYIGLSLFEASRRGKFHYNAVMPQDEIAGIVRKTLGRSTDSLIQAQKAMLGNLLVGKYRGYAGVDMMARSGGAVRPCVEINLRSTMGIAALKLEKLSNTDAACRSFIDEHFPDAKMKL